MVTYVSKKITERLLRKEVIEHDDYEIYQYGMEQLLMTAINIVTIIILGIIFGKLWQSLVFAVAFMAIRSYAGGYHASTPVRCYLLTILIITAVLSVMRCVEVDIFICVGLLAISSTVILLLSPVESKNKLLDGIEKIIYREKTIIIWCTETVMAIVFILLNLTEISICITMAQSVLGLSQIVGLLQFNKMRNNN